MARLREAQVAPTGERQARDGSDCKASPETRGAEPLVIGAGSAIDILHFVWAQRMVAKIGAFSANPEWVPRFEIPPAYKHQVKHQDRGLTPAASLGGRGAPAPAPGTEPREHSVLRAGSAMRALRGYNMGRRSTFRCVGCPLPLRLG
jgi:hypothetical protein